MVVSCPTCTYRVRLDRKKYAGKRIKLRCGQCGEIFQAEIPSLESPVAFEKPLGTPIVLVAHSDPSFCEAVGEILTHHEIIWQFCHDGESALRLMAENPPEIAMVDVALPGLFAFEVVEKVRQRPGLEGVKIVLISSVYNKMAYKRRPHSLYGADDYIEKHHIPTDLIDKLQRLLRGADHSEAEVSLTPPLQQTVSEEKKLIDDVNNRLKQAEESESTISNNDSLVIEKACRLARIIVSDIALYNQSKVEEGIRTDCFYDLLSSEIAEGRKHFMERIPPDVPGREGILQEAFENLIAHRRREQQL